MIIRVVKEFKIRNFSDASITECANRWKDKKTHDIIYFL